MAKILVTGNRGYIGSRLQRRLEEIGYEVVGIDLQDGLDVLTADLPGVLCVYHLAAQSGAMPSIRDPMNDARQNVLGSIRIAKHYGDQGIPIIYVTSGGAIEPESPYGLSKKTGEEYMKMLALDNLRICRLSSVFGDKPRGVVDTFIRSEVCTVMGDGTAVRDFVHVDDVVEALVKSKKWRPSKVAYQLGSGQGVSVMEIAKATGKKIIHKPARKGEKQKVVLRNSTPDWKPAINVLAYVRSKC